MPRHRAQDRRADLSIARRIRRRRHARVRSPATCAIGASAGSLHRDAICADANESAGFVEATGRRLTFSLLCTNVDGRGAQIKLQSLAPSFDAPEVRWHGAHDAGGSSHARARPLIVWIFTAAGPISSYRAVRCARDRVFPPPPSRGHWPEPWGGIFRRAHRPVARSPAPTSSAPAASSSCAPS